MSVISAKSFKAGDVIFECKPLLICMIKGFQSNNCNNCLKKSDSLKRCTKCRQLYYCHKRCQKKDWEYHKNECQIYQKFDMSLCPIIQRYLLRLWLCVKSNPEFGERRHRLIDGSDVSLNEVKACAETIGRLTALMKSDVREKKLFLKICKNFKRFGIEFDRKELLQWYAFIKRPFNLSIMYYDGCPHISFKSITKAIGFGLYIQLSNISHSCVPNCGLTRNGLSLQLRAMKTITSGEQITVPYIYLDHNKLFRQQKLSTILVENCQCDRCRLDLDKDWDYKEWKDVFNQNWISWSTICSPLFCDSLSVSYEINSDLLKYLELFYGKYNPHSNELILLSFIVYTYHSRVVSPINLTKWFIQFKESMAITHGSGHPLYEMVSTVYNDCLSN